MRTIAARGLLVVLSALLPLGMLEVALRALYPNPRILVSDTVLGTVPRPNMDVRKRFGGHETVVRIRTNSLGLRNPEVAPKPPDGARVLALGDSFTFGHAVEAAEAWPRVTEALLRGATRRPVEVVNAGISGHGTGQALLLYRRLEATVRPDLVVLGFAVVNDTLDNLCVEEGHYRPISDAPCFQVGQDGALSVRAPVLIERPAQAGVSSPPHFEVVEFVLNQAKRATLWNPGVLRALERLGASPALPYLPSTVQAWYENRLAEPGLALTRRLVEELRDALGARGATLMILIIPSSVQVDRGRLAALASLGKDLAPVKAFLGDPRRPQRLLAGLCAEVGVECLDPLPALLAAEDRGERTYFAIDGHWTPAGHRIAAGLVARRLRERESAR